VQRSDSKILTTHVGSLPFLSPDKGLATGDDSRLTEDVAAIVAQQRETGIDVINEGEFAKGGDWLRYMQSRFGGFTEIGELEGKPLIERGKDREEFAEFYKYANERGTLFYTPGCADGEEAPGSSLHRTSKLYRASGTEEGDRRHHSGRGHEQCVSYVDRTGQSRSLSP
jgi:hypothetical protein